MTKDENILIVGLGLLGGSYALGLHHAGYHVLGQARRQETIDYALKHQMIDEGCIDSSLVAKADLIICCLYPSIMLEWISANKHLFKKDAIMANELDTNEATAKLSAS